MGRNHDFLMNQFGPFHPVIFHCTTQRKPQGIADEPEGITCRKKCLTCRSAELFEDRRLYVFLYVYFDICLIYLNLLILILHSSFLLCFFLSLCLSLSVLSRTLIIELMLPDPSPIPGSSHYVFNPGWS